MQRRKFFGWLGLSWLASVLPLAITAILGSKTQPSSANTPRADGFMPVGTLSALDKDGFLKAEINQKPVIVVRDSQKKNALSAVTSICTHKGCKVEWKAADKALKCPCHAAQFAADGKVLKGPAKSPLAAYTAKIEGNNVLVKLS